MPATLTANWNYPTRRLVRPGASPSSPRRARARGIARPLFVTDTGLADCR